MGNSKGYILAFRRYAPFDSFGGGFEGDGRTSASTRDDVTFRTGAFIEFDRSGVLDKRGSSSGTRWVYGDGESAEVKVTVSHVTALDSKLLFAAHSEGANPLVPLSPDIDTYVQFGALWVGNRLVVLGYVSGDGFPNAEVYIKDPRENAILLVDYKTGSGTTGPFHRLFGGNSGNEFARFKCIVSLKPDGSFGKVQERGPHFFTDMDAMPDLVPRMPPMRDLLNPRNWM